MVLLWPRPDKKLLQAIVARATLLGSADAYRAGMNTGGADVGRLNHAANTKLLTTSPEVPLVELETRAEIAAANYAEAWLASFRARDDILRKYGERTVARQATEEQAYRVSRIAATETPAAFNEARLETVRASLGDSELDVIRIWRCDAGPCDICASYEGDIADVNGSYSSGEEPGSVHPHCRCSEDIALRH